ncbi:RidA family protein [Salibacterium aidingense]|uniref:RidA family protein n=1 Tax=Salibacterium aidingense TaxID=384933 RepID=UPI003BBA247F
MSVYDRLSELSIEIPRPAPRFQFVPGVQAGSLLFVSGQTPERDGTMVITGRLGADLSIKKGQEAARLACLNCLGEAESVLGSLNRIKQVVRVIGYVRSAENFGEQPYVINGASKLLYQILGERGKHARAALGMNELPFQAPVELEMIFEVEEDG